MIKAAMVYSALWVLLFATLLPSTEGLSQEETEELITVWSDSAETIIESLENGFETAGRQSLVVYLQQKRDEWKTVPLNVAVVGSRGAHKTSFINAIMRLNADDEGAAEVEATETTIGLRAFPHPDNPMLKFWDLPDPGAPRFPKDSYLEDIVFDRYDFFIIITATNFTDNDMWFADRIRHLPTKVFVRTNLESDVKNHKKLFPETHHPNDVVRPVRLNAFGHLVMNGFNEGPIYLIDNFETKKYDFEELERSLADEFPEAKRSAMILSMRSQTKHMTKLKASTLRWHAVVASLARALTDSVPSDVESLSETDVLDYLMTVHIDTGFYFEQLAIDQRSLMRLASAAHVDVQNLLSVKEKYFGNDILSLLNPSEIALKLTQQLSEQVSDAILLPATAVTAFGISYSAHMAILEKGEVAALEILKYVDENRQLERGHDEL